MCQSKRNCSEHILKHTKSKMRAKLQKQGKKNKNKRMRCSEHKQRDR